MSGQFNKSNFEQNPSNLKKKRNNKGWATNDDSSLRDDEVLNEDDIKAIKEDQWLEKHIPKPTKKEIKYRRRINELENASLEAELSKKEKRELKKLKKKHKKLYNYRHQDHSSNHTTLKCCLTTLVIVVVLACTAVFGGYSLFVQQYTGVSLIELTEILGGLYKADEENLITQQFDPVADSEEFFKGLQNALYLNKAFTLDDLLQLIPTNQGGSGDDSASVADLLDQAKEPVADGSFTGNAYLDELLSETKFDFSSLKDFQAGSTPKWEITDKMIAAVMQQVVLNADDIPQIKEMVSQYNISIKNSLTVKQCLIQKNADGDTTMKLTLQVKINNLATDLLSGMDLGGANFLKNIIPLVLPKYMYLTATVTPEVDKAPVLGINSINEKTLQTLIYTIDSKVLNGQIESIFNKVGNTIFSTFKQMNDMVGNNGISISPTEINDANGVGKIQVDILQTAMSTMGVKNVTSSDFLLMVKHLHSIDNNYVDVDAYINANITNKSTPDDFVTSKNELFSAYGIDTKAVEDITAENFIEKLDKVPELINIKDTELYKNTNAQLQNKSKLSDKALAQVMNKMIATKLGENGLEMNIIELTMKATSMEMIASLDIGDMLEKQLGDKYGVVKPLIMSIFPEHIFIKVIVPYERKTDPSSGENIASCNVIFNYTKDEGSEESSDKMFDTINKIMNSLNSEGEGNNTSNFDKESIIKTLDNAIYPVLNDFNSGESDIEISFTEGGIQLPTVYELLAKTINDGASESDKMSAETIQKTMASYYTYDEIAKPDENGIITNHVKNTYLDNGDNNFIARELKGKFFLAGDINEGNVFNTMTTIGSNLTADKINTAINVEALKNNNNPINESNFAITSLEFAKLMVLSGKLDTSIGNIGFYKNFTFVDMSTDGNALTLVMAGELDAGSTTVAGGIKIENFAANYLIVQAKIYLNSDAPAEIKVNNAGGEDIDNLLKIVNKVASSSDSFNSEKLAGDIDKAIKDALKEFEDQGMKFTATTDAYNNKNGFTSTNVYELISKKSTGEANYTEGDDAHLKNIIYKLNHPNEDTKEEFVALTGSDGKFNGVINESPREEGEISLIQIDEYGGKRYLNVYDMYLGQQVKDVVAQNNANMTLIKFAMLGTKGDHKAQFRTFMESLGITESTSLNTLYNSYNNVMFMEFKINSAEIGGNDLVNCVLPEYIYGGAFVDFTDMSYPISHIFINNLSDNEMSYLDRLIAGNDQPSVEPTDPADPSTPVTGNSISEKLENVLTQSLTSDFEVTITSDSGTYTKTFKIAEIYSKFELDVVVAQPHTKYTYGYLIKELTAEDFLPEVTA